MKNDDEIVALVRDTLVDAGSTFRSDKKMLPGWFGELHEKYKTPAHALHLF